MVEIANAISVLEKKIKKYEKAETGLAKISIITDACDYLLSIKYKSVACISAAYFFGRVDDNAKKIYDQLNKHLEEKNYR